MYVFIPSAASDIALKLPFSSGPIFPSVAHSVALDPPPLLQVEAPGLGVQGTEAQACCAAEMGRRSGTVGQPWGRRSGKGPGAARKVQANRTLRSFCESEPGAPGGLCMRTRFPALRCLLVLFSGVFLFFFFLFGFLFECLNYFGFGTF